MHSVCLHKIFLKHIRNLEEKNRFQKQCIEILKIIQNDSYQYITSEGREFLSTQKWTNCDIGYDLYCFSDCTKSLCLDIKMKMNVLEKLYLLVKILNMNDDNEEKCYGVSTDFIRKLTGFIFIIIGRKESKNVTLRKMYCFKKCNTDMSLWTHVLTDRCLSSVF